VFTTRKAVFTKSGPGAGEHERVRRDETRDARDAHAERVQALGGAAKKGDA
jgi:hypothetical protein